jgi:hypothetical protein
MKNYFGKFSKWAKTTQPYFLDFIVVVLGIMLSLWFNDRRQQNEALKNEKQILEQVLEDLKADTAKLNQNLVGLKEMTRSSIKLVQMSKDSIIANCLDVYINTESVITYIPFDPSKVGYFELSVQGKSGNVTDKKLLMSVMSLYEDGYKRISELTITHRDYLIDNVYKYITQKIPYVDISRNTVIADDTKEAIANAILADEFKHMLFFDIVVKQNLGMAYTQVLDEQKNLIEEITKKLNR